MDAVTAGVGVKAKARNVSMRLAGQDARKDIAKAKLFFASEVASKVAKEGAGEEGVEPRATNQIKSN